MSSPAPASRSVSIADDAAKASPEPRSPMSVPAAGVKMSPKAVEKQLISSIPEKEMAIIKGWKVKQVVITKLDSGNSGGSSVSGINVAPGAGPPPMLSKLKKQGTSKMHKFTPSVTLEQAAEWLSEYGLADSTILFDNQCCVLFDKASFAEFEDIRDEEDE